MSKPCVSPLFRIPVGSINFGVLSVSDQARRRNGGVFLKYDDLLNYENHPAWSKDTVQMLRCGQCINCRLASSLDWAVRLSLEAKLHTYNYFVTLTYDDMCLPRGDEDFVDFEGNFWSSTLYPKDVELFIKRYREYERSTFNNTGIRFFYCGEYGSLNGRPHYHLIMMGCSEISDFIFRMHKGSYDLFKSPTLEKFWYKDINGVKVPCGFIDVSEASFDTMAYTARYCLKKIGGLHKKEFMEVYNNLDYKPPIRLQPFVRMSRRPGIAYDYYQQNKFQIYLEDRVKYQKKFDLFISKPPRFFDKLFDREEPDLFSDIKIKRSQLGRAASLLKDSLSSSGFYDRLSKEKSIAERKMKKYVRDL